MFLLNVPSTVILKVNKLYRECEQRTVLLSKNIMAFLSLSTLKKTPLMLSKAVYTRFYE